MRPIRRPESPAHAKTVASKLRVIGGDLRRHTIPYNGDPGLRPMKDRVRESVFNLIGPQVVGKLVIDLFAGTGAMAIESLSRRADKAICIERKFPNAKAITETAGTLGLSERITVIPGDAFIWAKKQVPTGPTPWLVFCCPPYEFYVSRTADMLALIGKLWETAPSQSVFVVESDERFSMDQLPDASSWDVRQYLPAVIAIARKA